MTVPKPARLRIEHLPTVFPNAAGLDIGSAEIVAALPPDRDGTVVRTFATFTADLQQLVTWLLDHHIDTVAMESTGVYWIPIYEMLEAAAIRVYLVNARHFKIVPGRKSDYNDAQWWQTLHALGLLTGSFRPDDEMCVLRSLLRHRAQLIEHRSPHILHMQKALKLMNIQLPEVLTDLTGSPGWRSCARSSPVSAGETSWPRSVNPGVNAANRTSSRRSPARGGTNTSLCSPSRWGSTTTTRPRSPPVIAGSVNSFLL